MRYQRRPPDRVAVGLNIFESVVLESDLGGGGGDAETKSWKKCQDFGKSLKAVRELHQRLPTKQHQTRI